MNPYMQANTHINFDADKLPSRTYLAGLKAGGQVETNGNYSMIFGNNNFANDTDGDYLLRAQNMSDGLSIHGVREELRVEIRHPTPDCLTSSRMGQHRYGF